MTKNDYQDTLEYIKENVKLLDIIDGYGLKVIKESDGRHSMICPFHTEDTPSLKIYDNKSYFCFGCGSGYSVIDFIKMYENISFMDVINRYRTKSNTSSENLYQKIINKKLETKFELSDYMISSKYRLGITLREYLKNNKDKEELIDRCFYDMDTFFEDINNLSIEKIDMFEDVILERIV